MLNCGFGKQHEYAGLYIAAKLTAQRACSILKILVAG